MDKVLLNEKNNIKNNKTLKGVLLNENCFKDNNSYFIF
jgi:hypothetical protein